MLRRFHAIRVLRKGQPPRDSSRALVIYLNHASWWDPLVCLYLSRKFFPERMSFAPIDAESLRKYAFFAHIGFYGIEQHSPRGAVTFLRTTSAILDSRSNVVWLTPQGRFMDARERPLRFQRGIGALAMEAPEAVFLPLAVDVHVLDGAAAGNPCVFRRGGDSKQRASSRRRRVDRPFQPGAREHAG